jgi:isoquinoline 1-oxidoreductase beta subunit
MIAAEELEADWNLVRVEQIKPSDKFSDFGTGGSSSVNSLWMPLRKAGTAAKEMLVTAAAKSWNVPAAECEARRGEVIHKSSNRRAKYADLVDAAAKLDVPKNPTLKDPKDFTIIGTKVRGLDTPSRVDGSAMYGLDVRVPGMLRAAVSRCPTFGGSVKSVDDAKTKSMPGVKMIVPIDTGADRGVGVIADTTYNAVKGRDALKIEWDYGKNGGLSSGAIRESLREAVKKQGAIAQKAGDPATALKSAAKEIAAAYELPFVAHATMEPMNCVASVEANRCEIWAPTQSPKSVLDVAAKITGLPKSAITVNTTLLGGGFGRRFETDFVAEALHLSKAAHAPVQVVWTREDDMRHDYYRPISQHALHGALDAQGKLAVWKHRIAAPSIIARVFPGAIRNGLDDSAVDAAKDMPYAIPNLEVDFVLAEIGVPVGWWRSVFASQNAFAVESFIDELAAAGRRDPFEFRRDMITANPRMKAVLELAAAQSGWGKPAPDGRFRGIACCQSFGTRVAEVAEISLHPKNGLRVHRVTVAVDCGTMINPDSIEAQAQSAIVYGLGAALKGEITIANGHVEQANFDDYPMLKIYEMPEVQVFAIKSGEPPTGMGEPALPPIAPAVTNAIFAVTGKRIRRLPIRKEDLAISA